MADHAQRRRLDEIEQQIAAHRFSYLHERWKADNPSLPDIERAAAETRADFHEAESDRLLDAWDVEHTTRVRDLARRADEASFCGDRDAAALLRDAMDRLEREGPRT